MSDYTDLTIFKMYNQDKWCIRPLSWCGIWRRVSNDIELVSGNVLGVYDSMEEANRVLEGDGQRMLLTKEECLKNISAIEKTLIVVDDWETGATYLEHEDEIENLKQLIEEHFENPSLSWLQITNMIGKPIYATSRKEWFILGACDYYTGKQKRMQLVNRYGNTIELAFEDGEYFDREVTDGNKEEIQGYK